MLPAIAPTPQLSVVMPCYNEVSTIGTIVKRVLNSPWTKELIIVDDGSDDGTRDVLQSLDDPKIRVIYQPENQGKGAALRVGFASVTGAYAIIQDADLEYYPEEYGILLQPVLEGSADVVYGSRFLTDKPHRVLFFWHSVGNRLLTLLSNMSTNLNLTDMETCYKLFRREVLDELEITENGFGVEPQITAQVAAGGWRVWEVGISYAGRTYEDGKKIGWRDGVRALWVIFVQAERAKRRARARARAKNLN